VKIITGGVQDRWGGAEGSWWLGVTGAAGGRRRLAGAAGRGRALGPGQGRFGSDGGPAGLLGMLWWSS